jgi:nucleotide-binding universal stress UspA family protein
MTALHVAGRQRRPRSWQRHVGAALAPATSADAIIREVVKMGDSYGVEVKGAVRSIRPPQEAILRQLEVGGHNLLVMGVSPRPSDQLFFGEVPAELLQRAKCSVVFVASEPFTSAPESREVSAAPEPAAPFVPAYSVAATRSANS